jgi:hypothetical protein
MSAGRKRMWFDGMIYYGAAGATASTLLHNIKDASYVFEYDEGETTERGDGTVAPIKEFEVASRGVTIEFTMNNKDNDTAMEAMLTALFVGTPIALRTKDKSAGKGFDGDVVLSLNHDCPMNGGQSYSFTAKPNGRTRIAELYV